MKFSSGGLPHLDSGRSRRRDQGGGCAVLVCVCGHVECGSPCYCIYTCAGVSAHIVGMYVRRGCTSKHESAQLSFSSGRRPHLDSGRSKNRDRDSRTHRTCASATVAVPTSEYKGLDVWASPQSLGSLDGPTQPTRTLRWARRPAERGVRPPPDAWRSCRAVPLASLMHAPFARHASRHLTSALVCMGDRPQLWPAAHPRRGAHRRPDGARS